MKKVFFYTDTPIHGGAERHMLLLAKNLNKEKYQVALVCSTYKQLNQWCREWEEAGLPVHRLNVTHKHDPRHHSQLKKLLAKEQPDLVHVHLWNPGGCRYLFSAINKETTRLIATEHDPFPLSGLKKTIKKKCLKKTDHTITVSDANKKLCLQLYPEFKHKISTVHNGIDLAAFEKRLRHFSTQHRDKLREQLFCAKPEDFVILSIAELHPRKGLKYLLEAYAEIQSKEPKTRLIIVGEGPERKTLEKIMKKLELTDRVLLIGRQEDIPHILASANLFVLASVKEAFGLVLLEAMAAQVPIVATEVGGIPEIVQNHKNGELVEAQNYHALAQTIREVMSNNALMQKLTYMGHHRVKEFDVSHMVRKTENIYDTVLT